MQAATPVDPLVALFAFGVLVLLSTFFFWPGGGIVGRVRRARRSTERVQLEDALKHLYVSEHMGRAVSLESLAGAMGTSRGVAARTIELLAERGLATLDGEVPTLRDGGRDYAGRILRVHRLWERYLADRTGLKPSEWHDAAEETEHELSPHEVEALSSRLGHPLYDPHGDPIPNRMGQLPPLAGAPLSTIDAGEDVQVTHLEDEPPEIFAELDAMGFAPHVRLSVIERSPDTVRIRLQGRELSLSSMAASNITVRALSEGESIAPPSATLADHSRPGERSIVVGISNTCQGPQRRRLLDLGVVPGTTITAELVSTGGDPVAYRIRGALIALRREQAGWIEVTAPGAEAPATPGDPARSSGAGDAGRGSGADPEARSA